MRHTTGKRVRRRFAKHVPNMWTRRYFNATATLPNLRNNNNKFVSFWLYEILQDRCNTLNDSSKFSPPQTSIFSSYPPNSKKYDLSIANNPPAIAGVLNACVRSCRLFVSSEVVRVYHRKCKSQLKAPQCSSKLLM